MDFNAACISIVSFFSAVKPYDFLAWSVIISALIIFWKWHLALDNNFDIRDLVCEDGKLSSSKFMRTGSWAVMSYGFYLLAKTSPESLVGYAPLYGGIWVSARVLDKWQQNTNVNLNASQTTTETRTVEEKLFATIDLTPEQKDKLKQEFYSDK